MVVTHVHHVAFGEEIEIHAVVGRELGDVGEGNIDEDEFTHPAFADAGQGAGLGAGDVDRGDEIHFFHELRRYHRRGPAAPGRVMKSVILEEFLVQILGVFLSPFVQILADIA